MSPFKTWSSFLIIISVLHTVVGRQGSNDIKSESIEKNKTKEIDKNKDKSIRVNNIKNQTLRKIRYFRQPVRKLNRQMEEEPSSPAQGQYGSLTTVKEDRQKQNKTKAITVLNPYNLYNQIQKIMSSSQLSKEANTTVEILARTAEYNDIVLVKASNITAPTFRTENSKYEDSDGEKKIVLIVHALSSMGLNGVPCLTYVEDFTELVHYYFKHLKDFDIFLVPMANPDGVVKEGTKSFWNKNNSPQLGCSGVALDRNFDVARNESGADPCSQQYPGPYAFSETESAAIKDIFHRYGHRIYGYIHVHPGVYTHSTIKGDAILYPKGFSDGTSDDDRYADLRGEIDEMMKAKNFRVMSVTVDTLYNWYGQVSGTSVDYASTIYGIPFAIEFVMQVYEYPVYDLVLTDVYKGIINCIFKSIAKHSQLKDNDAK